MTRSAEIVAVGDELLSGAGVNRNAAWLGEQLGAVDVQVRRGTVVGDDVDVIAEAIRTAASRSDLVVVTGGLGPTSDDRTRDAGPDDGSGVIPHSSLPRPKSPSATPFSCRSHRGPQDAMSTGRDSEP